MIGMTNLIAGWEILVVADSAPLYSGSMWNCQLYVAEKLHSRNTQHWKWERGAKDDFFPSQLSSDCFILAKTSKSFDELITLSLIYTVKHYRCNATLNAGENH